MNKMDCVLETSIPVGAVFRPSKGFLIRPYVNLQGLSKGLFWKMGTKDRGYWRDFMNTQSKYFTLNSTGRTDKINVEAQLSDSYFYGACTVDNRNDADNILPYIYERLYPKHKSDLFSLSRRFGQNAMRMRVALDEYEAKMHTKFANIDNSNQHEYLPNVTDDGLVIDVDGRHYHLMFEVRNCDENISLTDTHVVKVRTRNMQQHFRRWHFVPHRHLAGALLTSIRDKSGVFYISDTRYYVPFWLRNVPVELPVNEVLAIDTLLQYSVPNRPRHEITVTEPQICECRVVQNDDAKKDLADSTQFGKVNNQCDRNNTMVANHRSHNLPALGEHLGLNISEIHIATIKYKTQPRLNISLAPSDCFSIAHTPEEHDLFCINRKPMNNQKSGYSTNDPAAEVVAQMRDWFLIVALDDWCVNTFVHVTRSLDSYCREFSAKINQLNFTPTLNNFSMGEENVASEPGNGDSSLQIEDLKLAKQFIDKMLDYNDYKIWLKEQEGELRDMLKEAIEKTMVERINLDAKGAVGDPRMAQIVKQYSLNTVHISEAARSAREKYNLNAKAWNDGRIVKAPTICDETKSALDRISNQGNISLFIKQTQYKYFETAAELRNTTIYRDMVNKLCEE